MNNEDDSLLEMPKRLEQEKKKKNLIEILICIAIILALLSGFIVTIVNYCNFHKYAKSPLGWCLWEIHTHEDYDCDFTYYYEELEPKSEIRKEADKGCELYCYYITCFTDDRKGEWYCFIECYHKLSFDNAVGYKLYNLEEVVAIDCDIAIETFYGYYGEENL